MECCEINAQSPASVHPTYCMEPITLFSVGHGNRSIAELLDILQRCGIATVVDLRANPQSRRHPQFEGDSLRQAIESTGLVYHWAGRHLGGRRAPRATSRHSALTDDGLRGFADHMDTPEFARGVSQLRQPRRTRPHGHALRGTRSRPLSSLPDRRLADIAGHANRPPARARRIVPASPFPACAPRIGGACV